MMTSSSSRKKKTRMAISKCALVHLFGSSVMSPPTPLSGSCRETSLQAASVPCRLEETDSKSLSVSNNAFKALGNFVPRPSSFPAVLQEEAAIRDTPRADSFGMATGNETGAAISVDKAHVWTASMPSVHR